MPGKFEQAVDLFLITLNEEYTGIGKACRNELGPEASREDVMEKFRGAIFDINPLEFWGRVDPAIRLVCPGFLDVVQRILQRFASTSRVEAMWSYFRHVLTDERAQTLPERASRLNRSYVRDRLQRAARKPLVLPKLPPFGVLQDIGEVALEVIDDAQDD